MVPSPAHLRLPGLASRAKTIFLNSLNFYRVHLIAFTLIPLVMSGIMYGVNTEYKIEYIDCLFNCMSAMTVTGLATVNLSTLSAVQQAILYVQMVIGSPTVVSIIMIVVRRRFFQVRFKHVIQEEQKRRSGFNLAKTISRVTPSGPPLSSIPTAIRKRFSTSSGRQEHDRRRASSPVGRRISPDQAPTPSTVELKPIQPMEKQTTIQLKIPPKPKGGKKKQNISTSMIKRVEGGGVGLVNPMGWYDGRMIGPERMEESAIEDSDEEHTPRPPRRTSSPLDHAPNPATTGLGLQDLKEDGSHAIVDTPQRMSSVEEPMATKNFPYAGKPVAEEAFPRSRTIAFDDDDDNPRGMASAREGAYFPRTATYRSQNGDAAPVPFTATSSFPRTYSLRPVQSRKPDAKLSGFGGFPTPLEIASSLVQKFAPNASRTLTKTFTMPRTSTVGRTNTFKSGKESALASEGGTDREAPYITFAATVGRNSRFTGLTEEQMDELGGVEYRALRVLIYIVIGYVAFLQIAAFVIIAPYIGAQGRYDHVFDAQPRLVKTPWFALFQVTSAFSNTGMSLVDMSLIPFQGAYLMNFVIFFLIFAGNTAFPVFLRLTVWIIYKLSPTASKTRETLKFLLDHPRRCFIYLFPSTQTWVLALVMVSLTFLVLDIGTPVIQAIPVGRRIAAGFIQSAAVRAAGFAIVPLNSLAPAVKVLYTIMMYISVYPIALSVRSTNVYEEKSLGLFQDDEDDEFETDEKGAQAVAKYMGWHARRQLAFDIWWLAFALWLICIIERHALDETDNASWFNVFNIIFEIVSGYGTVGLSLGVGNDNYSLSGSFRKLSKLVLIAVMLRGRHRGLPVAIDRAVMLPKDFTKEEEESFEETRSRRMSRRGSFGVSDEFMANLRRGSTSNMSASGWRESSVDSMKWERSQNGDNQPQGKDHHVPNADRRNSNVPGSPTATFATHHARPRSSAEWSDSRPRSPVNTRGNLTPVQEGTMSRANTNPPA